MLMSEPTWSPLATPRPPFVRTEAPTLPFSLSAASDSSATRRGPPCILKPELPAPMTREPFWLERLATSGRDSPPDAQSSISGGFSHVPDWTTTAASSSIDSTLSRRGPESPFLRPMVTVPPKNALFPTARPPATWSAPAPDGLASWVSSTWSRPPTTAFFATLRPPADTSALLPVETASWVLRTVREPRTCISPVGPTRRIASSAREIWKTGRC
mmetsp:Transcript_3388/g.8018  ORF Transcript_3388/g.8018 Transcript_3388/m.8018 type:complete len:215 (-) Transcript_3388:1016-1660(-)